MNHKTRNPLLLIFVLTSCVFGTLAQTSELDSSNKLVAALDSNKDDLLDPYEALAVLLSLQDELQASNSDMSYENVLKALDERKRKKDNETGEMLTGWDKNGDGVTKIREVPKSERGFAKEIDSNRDGIITVQEVDSIESAIFLDESDIQQEVSEIFEDIDSNSDQKISKSEADGVHSEVWEEIGEADFDHDNAITVIELNRMIASNVTPASFRIEGDVAVMEGVISSSTPAKVIALIFENPSVHTIEMAIVPGSIDDQSNLEAARLVRHHEFNTRIRAGQMIASGGTDFFLAGAKREVEPGARIGIHAWGGAGESANDISRDAPEHDLYLDYYRSIGIKESFYWRTLEAAPADGIHWMTEAEIEEFNVRTN